MSPFRRAFLARVSIGLTVVLSVMVVGASLATAADLTESAAPTKPKTVPPIVSPSTDQAPAMPAGHAAALAPGAAPATIPDGPVTAPPSSLRGAAMMPPLPPSVSPERVVQGFVAGKSVEKAAARTDRSTTFDNPDGSHTTQISNRPTRFQGRSGWTDIDNTLVGDAAHPGGFRNRANAFVARFAPLPSGVSIEAPQGTVSMTPQGLSGITPVVAADGSSLTYPDVWPGVDVRYQVEANVVKEDIILRRRPGSSTFRFAFSGTQLSPDADGGLDLSGAIGTAWRVAPPEVFDVKGIPVAAADPHLTVESNGTVAALSISDAWLAGLSSADYPVTIDPTVAPAIGGAQSNSYKSDGGSCTPCAVRVGNPLQSNPGPVWRGAVYFDYTGLYGKHIVDASVHVWNLTAGTPSNQWLNVYQATGWDFGSVGPWLGASSQPGSDYTIDTTQLRDFYNGWTTQRVPGVPLKFIGNENQGQYSYKEMNSFLLTLTYSDPPVVSNVGPGNGISQHDNWPVFSVSAWDPNGDAISSYRFEIATDSGFQNIVGLCDWNASSSCQIGLPWNQTFWWRAKARDVYGDEGTGPGWSYTAVNHAPTTPALVNPAPGDGVPVHTLTPTLAASSSDSDPDALLYRFRLTTGTDPNSGILWQCDWQSATTCPVPANTIGWGTYYWHVWADDLRIAEGTEPYARFTLITTNSAPQTPTQALPNDNVTVVQTNLSFTANTAPDNDVDPITGQHTDTVSYQFQVATGTDGQSGRLALSQWQSGPTWAPPAGTFADGGKYTWLVRAEDNFGAISGWSPVRTVKIDFRLGQKPNLPYDSAGPASVNLSNGNLVLTPSLPSFPTVGGPAGATLAYNSQAPVVHGLTGDYYQDTNANGVYTDDGQPLLHRIDPQLSFEWGSPGSGPNSAVLNPEHWMGHWTGTIRGPAKDANGNPEADNQWWVLVTDHTDDSLTVKANASTVLTPTGYDQTAVSTPVQLSQSSGTNIDVTYVQYTGPEHLHLKIKKQNDPLSAAFEVPSDWFFPTQPTLPDGWSRAGDGLAQAAYTALRPVNGTAVGATTAVVDASGADHLYNWSGSGWAPPPGENGVLTQKQDSTWTLLGEDGYLYGFDNIGHLTDVRSPADDTHPGALTYHYFVPNPGETNAPLRLQYIADALDRRINFAYGPPTYASSSCPTDTGFATTAPADMLCKVSYTDFGGGATELYYSIDAQGNPSGHLARLVTYTGNPPNGANPKGETVDFGYNTDGLLTQIRDPLTNDLVGAGIFTDPASDSHKWIIGYDTDPTPAKRKILSIKAPVADAAMMENARPLHSYVYTPTSGLPTQTDVQIAGGNGPGGYARRVLLDEGDHITPSGAGGGGYATSGYDAAGIRTETFWDLVNDRPTKTIDHHYRTDPVGGLVTTSFYDAAGNVTDSYGPAPTGEFDGQGRSTTAPHSTSAYDETTNGLAAAWFDNPDLSATPKAHTTSSLQENWAAGSPAATIPSDNFSGRLTGEVTLPQAGTLTLAADGGRVVVDDNTMADTWGGPYPSSVNADKPLSYWRFRETSGTTANDQTGYAKGTYTGGVTLGTPSNNLAAETGDTAASFDGVNDYVAAPNGFDDFSGGLAIEAWVYPTSNANWSRIVDLGNGTGVDNILFARYGTTNTLHFDIRQGTNVVASLDAANALVNNQWQHLAVTMTPGGTITIYRNGTAVATTEVGTGKLPLNLPRTSNFIGRSNWAADSYFAGQLDEVAIYRSALSSARIAAHANAAPQTTSTATTSTIAAGTHRLRIDYQELTGNANLQLTSSVTGTTFKPRYKLLTTATDADGKVVKHEYSPEIGLDTATVADPAGANLRTTTGYEAAGTGYYRRTSRTLPAGTTTTYAYYGQGSNPTTANNPCPGGATGINQGGALWKTTGPDPDGAGSATARVEESVYDAAGHPVASRVGSEAWTCLTYDHRGRVLSKTIPLFDAGPARTISYSYAAADASLGGIVNPAITTTTDSAGTVTTKVDWLGRVVSYTDLAYSGFSGDTTTTTYDQAGRMTDTAVTNPNSPTSTFHTDYDSAGRPSIQKLDGTVVASATYDPPSGVLTATSYPTGTGNAGNGTSGTRTQDNRGRLIGLTWKKPDGTTTLTSDSVTRSAGGKLTDETIDGTDPYPTGVNFTYDGASRLTDARAPGHHYTYSFAATAGCGYQTNAGLNTNRTTTTDNGGTATTYCYDAADRLTSTSDARYGGISYDTHGNTKTIGGQTLGYDDVDRHLTTTTGTAAAQTTISYTRDATDRITARTLSTPGTVTFRAAAGANNAAGATTLAINRPAGTQPGDVLLAQVTTATPTATVTAPAGWTLQNSTADAGNNVRDLIYWRVAATNDPASWTWTFSSSLKASGGISAYAGVDPTNPINASAVTTNSTATSLVAPAVTTTKDKAMVVATYGTRTGTTITPPSGMSERYDQASTGSSASSRTTSEAADQTQATAGTTGTRTATAAASVTASVNRTIALTPAPIVTTVRYGYSGSGDSPDLTLDATNTVVERTIALLGDVLLTKRTAGDVWSYPNIHGDITATATATGAPIGGTSTYDPYGQALAGIPDNSGIGTANFDYGWLGQHQRPLEHEGTLATVEMGDRQYLPGLGRFIELDPVEGGSANNYEYAAGDPINNFDLDGNKLPCFSCAARHVKNATAKATHTAATFVNDHLTISVGVCVVRCISYTYQRGTLWQNTGGWGLLTPGFSAGFATAKPIPQDRDFTQSCLSFGSGGCTYVGTVNRGSGQYFGGEIGINPSLGGGFGPMRQQRWDLFGMFS